MLVYLFKVVFFLINKLKSYFTLKKLIRIILTGLTLACIRYFLLLLNIDVISEFNIYTFGFCFYIPIHVDFIKELVEKLFSLLELNNKMDSTGNTSGGSSSFPENVGSGSSSENADNGSSSKNNSNTNPPEESSNANPPQESSSSSETKEQRIKRLKDYYNGIGYDNLTSNERRDYLWLSLGGLHEDMRDMREIEARKRVYRDGPLTVQQQNKRRRWYDSDNASENDARLASQWPKTESLSRIPELQSLDPKDRDHLKAVLRGGNTDRVIEIEFENGKPKSMVMNGSDRIKVNVTLPTPENSNPSSSANTINSNPSSSTNVENSNSSSSVNVENSNNSDLSTSVKGKEKEK